MHKNAVSTESYSETVDNLARLSPNRFQCFDLHLFALDLLAKWFYVSPIKVQKMGRSSFTVLFYAKHARAFKNGHVPLYVRITVQGERAEFSLNQSVDPALWDGSAGRVSGNTKQSKEINALIESVKMEINTKRRELLQDGKQVTAENLKKAFLGIAEEYPTLVKTFEEHNERCKKLEGIDFAAGTVVKYQACLKQLKGYLENWVKRKDVGFDEITPRFLSDFEAYLKTDGGCRHNSAVKYLANLKKIIRIAQANGWMRHNPYATLKFRLEEVDVHYLTETELERLRNKHFKIQRLEAIKDIYVFCCFTGLAFSDVKSLQAGDIVELDGMLWIKKRRRKTNVMSSIPLLGPAQEILRKYEGHPTCETKGVLLPVPTNQKMNAYLKEIADLCGIEKHLSTHTARHTFATTVTLGNQVSMEVVAKMLGHTDIKMTKRYARVVDDLVKKDMQKVRMKFGSAICAS